MLLILEQRSYLATRQSLAGLDARRLASASSLQGPVASNPESPIRRSEHGVDLRRAQPFSLREDRHFGVAKTIDANSCRHPDVTFTVLEYSPYGVTRQAICPTKMYDL